MNYNQTPVEVGQLWEVVHTGGIVELALIVELPDGKVNVVLLNNAKVGRLSSEQISNILHGKLYKDSTVSSRCLGMFTDDIKEIISQIQ